MTRLNKRPYHNSNKRLYFSTWLLYSHRRYNPCYMFIGNLRLSDIHCHHRLVYNFYRYSAYFVRCIYIGNVRNCTFEYNKLLFIFSRSNFGSRKHGFGRIRFYMRCLYAYIAVFRRTAKFCILFARHLRYITFA